MRDVHILISGEKNTAFPVLNRILNRASQAYKVVAEACGAAAALQLLQDNAVDIVLVDASGAEGIGLCRRITERFPQLRVVLVGGRRDYEYLKQAMEACAQGYIAEDECTGERIRMEINRVLQNESKLKEPCPDEPEPDFSSGGFAVARTMEFIRLNYRTNLSFSEAAEYAGISESHLRRCFRKKTGKSFVDYLTEYRINTAKHLMRHEDWPVSRISEETGFSSLRYFCKVFKTMTGKTPREYMQEQKKDKQRGSREQ